jgi:hypothetical protein
MNIDIKAFTAAALLTATTAPAATMELPCTDDAYIVESSPADNFGTEASLIVYGGPDESAVANKIYLRFDASSVEGVITDAKLELVHEGKRRRCAGVFLVEGAGSAAWNEKEITWNNAPGNDLDSNFSLDGGEAGLISEIGSICGADMFETSQLEATVSGGIEKLIQALNSGDRVVTLVIVQGSNSRAYPSIFTSKENPVYKPPLLLLEVKE